MQCEIYQRNPIGGRIISTDLAFVVLWKLHITIPCSLRCPNGIQVRPSGLIKLCKALDFTCFAAYRTRTSARVVSQLIFFSVKTADIFLFRWVFGSDIILWLQISQSSSRKSRCYLVKCPRTVQCSGIDEEKIFETTVFYSKQCMLLGNYNY